MEDTQNSAIKWGLYDPLQRGYFWLDILEPVLTLAAQEKTKHAQRMRKEQAYELAKKALELARKQHPDYDIRAVRVMRENRVMRNGQMRLSYLFFKIEKF